MLVVHLKLWITRCQVSFWWLMYGNIIHHYMIMLDLPYKGFVTGREGTLGCLLHLSPKYNSNFLKSFICWLIKLSVQTFLTSQLIVIYSKCTFGLYQWGHFINLSAIVISLIPVFIVSRLYYGVKSYLDSPADKLGCGCYFGWRP